jgi:hypothetical protein
VFTTFLSLSARLHASVVTKKLDFFKRVGSFIRSKVDIAVSDGELEIQRNAIATTTR